MAFSPPLPLLSLFLGISLPYFLFFNGVLISISLTFIYSDSFQLLSPLPHRISFSATVLLWRSSTSVWENCLNTLWKKVCLLTSVHRKHLTTSPTSQTGVTLALSQLSHLLITLCQDLDIFGQNMIVRRNRTRFDVLCKPSFNTCCLFLCPYMEMKQQFFKSSWMWCHNPKHIWRRIPV